MTLHRSLALDFPNQQQRFSIVEMEFDNEVNIKTMPDNLG